jgi:hypothetical protein
MPSVEWPFSLDGMEDKPRAVWTSKAAPATTAVIDRRLTIARATAVASLGGRRGRGGLKIERCYLIQASNENRPCNEVTMVRSTEMGGVVRRRQEKSEDDDGQRQKRPKWRKNQRKTSILGRVAYLLGLQLSTELQATRDATDQNDPWWLSCSTGYDRVVRERVRLL